MNGLDWIVRICLALLFFVITAAYLSLVERSNRRLTKWPLYKSFCWFGGWLTAAYSVYGVLFEQPNFIEHMIHHLVLGMLSPLLIVLSSPITLLLRSLSVAYARRITKILKSPLVCMYHHPIIASLLNIGGLWLLYRTDLYHWMHQHFILSLVIHVHLFVAGYLFTASMIAIDPSPRRYSFRYRAIVFILALAGHAMLSKWIYADPPKGVSTTEAEIGGMLMYYGGDWIDLVIIYVLWHEEYRKARSNLLMKKIEERWNKRLIRRSESWVK